MPGTRRITWMEPYSITRMRGTAYLKLTAKPFLRVYLLCVVTAGVCYIVARQLLPLGVFGGQLWRPFVFIGAVMPAMAELTLLAVVWLPRWNTVRENLVYSTVWSNPVRAEQIETVRLDLGSNPAPHLRVEYRSPKGRIHCRRLFLSNRLDLHELTTLLPKYDPAEPVGVSSADVDEY